MACVSTVMEAAFEDHKEAALSVFKKRKAERLEDERKAERAAAVEKKRVAVNKETARRMRNLRLRSNQPKAPVGAAANATEGATDTSALMLRLAEVEEERDALLQEKADALNQQLEDIPGTRGHSGDPMDPMVVT